MLGACLLFAAVACLAMISPDEKNITLGDDGGSSVSAGAEAQEVRVRGLCVPIGRLGGGGGNRGHATAVAGGGTGVIGSGCFFFDVDDHDMD